MPTSAAELREIAAGSEVRIRVEYFSKYFVRAVEGIREAAREGNLKFVFHVGEPKHRFMVPDLISEIQKEFPGVAITTRGSGYETTWLTVSWEV